MENLIAFKNEKINADLTIDQFLQTQDEYSDDFREEMVDRILSTYADTYSITNYRGDDNIVDYISKNPVRI